MLSIIFAPFYILVNIYLVRWIFRWSGACHHIFSRKSFRIGFSIFYSFFALTPLTSFFIKSPKWLYYLLRQISNYWFGWLLYFILTVIISEATLAMIRKARKKDFLEMQAVRRLQGGFAIAALLIIGFFGMAQAQRLHITQYNIQIPKKGQDMVVALVADLHLGVSTNPEYIAQMAEEINKMNADMVIIAGDIFDNEYEDVPEADRILQILSEIKSKYGVYACWGNHDLREPILAGFTWNSIEDEKDDPRMQEFLKKAGITLLEDEAMQLPNGAYIIGREDPSRNKKLQKDRKKPKELIKGLDEANPIIMIDHQPKELDELSALGIDLDLSGHTHDGQMFPGNLTIKLMWDNAYGYKKIGDMYSVVTSGVGIWGPNMRVGTKSEVVKINISCAGQSNAE